MIFFGKMHFHLPLFTLTLFHTSQKPPQASITTLRRFHHSFLMPYFKMRIKVPLLWVMKVHILVVGVPNNRCMQGKKTLSFSYNMHLIFTLFAQRLPLISKPLLCVMLICGDWSISFKAEAVLLCVQRYRGNSSKSGI